METPDIPGGGAVTNIIINHAVTVCVEQKIAIAGYTATKDLASNAMGVVAIPYASNY